MSIRTIIFSAIFLASVQAHADRGISIETAEKIAAKVAAALPEPGMKYEIRYLLNVQNSTSIGLYGVRNNPAMQQFTNSLGESSFKRGICEVRLSPRFLEFATEDQVAFVVGHEFGHCVMDASGGFTFSIPSVKHNWQEEYEADAISGFLMDKLGIPKEQVVEQCFGNGMNDSDTHPGGHRRVLAIKTGELTFLD